MSLYDRSSSSHSTHSPTSLLISDHGNMQEPKHHGGSSEQPAKNMAVAEPEIPESMEKQSMQAVASCFKTLINKIDESPLNLSKNQHSSDSSDSFVDYEGSSDESSSCCTFEEGIENLQSIDEEYEMPENLEGGVLLDLTYAISPKELNTLLFGSTSQFRQDLAKLQEITDLQEGAWMWDRGVSCLKRVISYTKAETKAGKDVKAIEEQTYLKADGKEFAVLTSVNIPDVPYGKYFNVEVLYKIAPGPELAGEESSHLIISWNINFFQSTLLKGFIEGATRHALKENFEQVADLLIRYVKPVESSEEGSLDKKQALSSLHEEHQCDWDLAVGYFFNFTVFTTFIMVLYVILHILLSGPIVLQGLEFNGLDLPDSFGEVVTCAILVFQCQSVLKMISHFMQARMRRGRGHNMKAQGEGWLLTVALIEGNNLASLDPSGVSDPYVVFTCNGKTRTSSTKLQTNNPQWNEILEFDVMEEPPAVLDVEVFDFDGPFNQIGTLGHAEINFLKRSSADLADIWVPLEGKLAQASRSKLHLRIFLDNNKGVEALKDYLTRMEKEVGKKLNIRSPQKNSTFQKHFGLPPDEFLINDFTCSLKRKMPLQGRLFLSARIMGFYANFFGQKTKFFFVWEDIYDIRILPPSLASMGSPTLCIILHKDHGVDARHGAKVHDEDGRLIFHFQSFVSFNVASRTILALWRTRTLYCEQRAVISDDRPYQDVKPAKLLDTASVLGAEVANTSKIFSAELPVSMSALMELFDGDYFDQKVMAAVGCLYYTTTPWEIVRRDVYERRISYKFHRFISTFGGEVTSKQQKMPMVDANGWMVNEVVTFHDVPFSDHFRVHLKYQIEACTSAPNACQCDVYIGTAWLKTTKFQERINTNICEKFREHLLEIFEVAEQEILLAKPSEIPT